MEMSGAAWVLVAIAGMAGLFLSGTILFLALFLPLAAAGTRLLPYSGPKRLEGVSNIEEAIAAGRATGLEGLELAAWAQGLAARRFEYSRRNPWDSPALCFERGCGYCVQQARALRLLLAGLGIESRIVQAFRCRFPAKTIHGEPSPPGVGGHAWVRARIGGRDYDLDSVCPGSGPGRLGFEALSRVLPMPGPSIPLFHILSVAENARRDARNILGRRGA
jgi:hypothetical protein